MSDPTRWRDDPSGPHGAILLRGARRPQPPAAHDLERLGAAVDAIARAPVRGAGRGCAWRWRARSRSRSSGGGTFVWALHARDVKRRRAARPRPRNGARATRARAPRSGGSAGAPSRCRSGRRPRAPRRARRRAEVAAAAPAAAPRRRDRRSRPIRWRARFRSSTPGRADLATAPSRALAALETHRREFPRGQLAAEREFLAVQALLQMNRIADAKKRADDLASTTRPARTRRAPRG